MLQTQTVVPDLLELLKKIMSEKLFSEFILVGGTSLALQIGHRNSIFDDANSEQTPPIYLNFNWENCKQKIIEEVSKL